MAEGRSLRVLPILPQGTGANSTPVPVVSSRIVGPPSLISTDTSSGTITLTGSATQSATYTDAGTGTITLSGTSTQSQTHTGTGTGTITLAGSRTETQSHSSSATGTVTLSGVGSEAFVPPGGSSAGWREQIAEIELVHHRF